MSTYAQLQANVTRRLRAGGYATWDTTEIQAEINAGYQEFCRQTCILRDTTTVTIVEDDALYAMPTVTGVSEIIKIWRAVWDDRELDVMTTVDMGRMFGGGWRDDTGTTLNYIMTDDEDPTQIRVYPMIESSDYIDTLTLSIDFSYIPTAMTTGSPAIPARFHPALEWWAVSQLQEIPVQSKQNPGMGDRAMAHWLRYVGSARIELAEGLMHTYGTHAIPTVI